MTLLDRYIARITLGALGATMLFFLFLSILVDLLNNLSDYVQAASENGIGGLHLAVLLVMHYLRLSPILFTTFTPLAMVIAAMFSVARLQHANEIVPMLFVGRSIRRVLRPMLMVGLFSGLTMAVCWQWVVPYAGAALLTDKALLNQNEAKQKSLVYEVHADVSTYLWVGEYEPARRHMHSINMLSQGVLAADAMLITATAADWDAKVGDWRLVEGSQFQRRQRMSAPEQWLGRPDVTPEVLMQAGRDTVDPDALSYSDLLDLEVTRPNRSDIKYSLHRHITYPLACILLLLLVLPMAVHFERGSRIERVLAAIALCGGYVLLDLSCQSLGQSIVHPIVAAWIPSIVFGALAVVLYGGMRT